MLSKLEALAIQFAGQEIGHQLRWLDIVDSTNRYVLDNEDITSGSVVLAGCQTAGRGRQSRSWFSGNGLGLYCTVALSPSNVRHIPLLGYVAALAIYDFLSPRVTGLNIKWPNDILVNGRKICGILGESRSRSGYPTKVALGFSVNLTQITEDFPAELQQTATSLLLETGQCTELAECAFEIIDALNHYYLLLQRDEEKILRSLCDRSTLLRGRRIKTELYGHKVVSGETAGLSPDGSLKLKLDNGETIVLQAGDVHLLDY